MNEYVDIREPVAEICRRLGLDETYVARLDIEPGKAEILLFRGKEGRCKGPRYIDLDTDKAATEMLTFKVFT